MIVYAVIGQAEHEVSDFRGVFSTKALAQAEVEKLSEWYYDYDVWLCTLDVPTKE